MVGAYRRRIKREWSDVELNYILKVKVGRNYFKIDIAHLDLLEFNIGLYENMEECSEIILYEIKKVIKG